MAQKTCIFSQVFLFVVFILPRKDIFSQHFVIEMAFVWFQFSCESDYFPQGTLRNTVLGDIIIAKGGDSCMEMTEWTSQVRRGILEFCILQLIGREPRYGYELVTLLDQWEPLSVTEGTLYPLLRRLQKDKYIESFWKESESGPPRKYYCLTDSGRALMDMMSVEWNKISSSVGQIQLFGGEKI
jgi:PadR family transcriptional regulator PadR